MDDYPEANLRHYHFMLEGLQDVAAALDKRRIKFVVQRGAPDEVALRLSPNVSLVVCDRGYLRPQRLWRERVADAPCRVVQVESDVVVPVELASQKKEHAARTLRPRLTRHLARFLVGVAETRIEQDSLDLAVGGEDLTDIGALLNKLTLEQQVPPVKLFKGGTSEAKEVLHAFQEKDFAAYADTRNQPQTSRVSHMSKYLHFGQISPIYVALAGQGCRSLPREWWEKHRHLPRRTYHPPRAADELRILRARLRQIQRLAGVGQEDLGRA
jgi:deoxyribodipyrimidine photo-lyase